jgi:hypothetical protein
MSALLPKADMCSATRDVRFVPIADIALVQSSQKKTETSKLKATSLRIQIEPMIVA